MHFLTKMHQSHRERTCSNPFTPCADDKDTPCRRDLCKSGLELCLILRRENAFMLAKDLLIEVLVFLHIDHTPVHFSEPRRTRFVGRKISCRPHTSSAFSALS